MKLLVLFASVLAAAIAWSPQHYPVIHNGVPVETAEVQHAKALYFAANTDYKQIGNNGIDFDYQHEDNIALGNDYDLNAHHGNNDYAIHHITAHHLGHYRKRRSADSYVHNSLPSHHDSNLHHSYESNNMDHQYQHPQHLSYYQFNNHHHSYDNDVEHKYQSNNMDLHEHQVSYDNQHYLLNEGNNANHQLHQSLPYEISKVNNGQDYKLINNHHYIVNNDHQQQLYVSSNDHNDNYQHQNNAPVGIYVIHRVKPHTILNHQTQSPIYYHHNHHQNTAPVNSYEIQKVIPQHHLIQNPSHPIYRLINHQNQPVKHQIIQIIPQHEVPSLGQDGKPLDTVAVEHAKVLHFAAHRQALTRNSQHGLSGCQNVVPVNAQQAKLQHFAAHAVARSHQH